MADSLNVTEADISTTARDLVRAEFNPSGLSAVDEIKILTARLITICQNIGAHNPHAARAAAIAVTNYEQAAMWAVKARTAPEPVVKGV